MEPIQATIGHRPSATRRLRSTDPRPDPWIRRDPLTETDLARRTASGPGREGPKTETTELTPDPDDHTLCEQAALGDRNAFGLLYDRHAGAIRELILARGGPPDLSWDLLHDTFAHALRALDRGQIPDRFDLWVRRIAVNVIHDHFRRPYATRESALDLVPSEMPAIPGADPDLPILLRDLLKRLPPELRSAVTLHFYQGLTVAETAYVLSVPVGTVKSRLSRAYRTLAEVLGPPAVRIPDEMSPGSEPARKRGPSCRAPVPRAVEGGGPS